MSVIERLKTYFPPEVYPAINDTSSELYILMNAIAESMEDFYDAVAVMRQQLTMPYATGYSMELLGNSYNVNKFQGEEENIFRLRFKAMTGMDKPTLQGIHDIVDMFVESEPVVSEPGNNIITVTIPGSTELDPTYYFTIGSDGTYGSAIGDDGQTTPGAIYSTVRSAIIVSLTYLQNLLNLIKPAGYQINIVEGE